MSDIFGIGAAAKGALRVCFLMARGTGRTTNLVKTVKPGDRIIFSNPREAERVNRLLREEGVEGVEIMVANARDMYALGHKLSQRGTPRGRLIFDHTWLEEYYSIKLEGAEKSLNELTIALGNEKDQDYRTTPKEREVAKWSSF